MITERELTERLLAKYGVLSYDDASHTYTRDDGLLLPSITHLKKKVTPAFDPGIKKLMSGKTGKTEEQIQESWDAIRDAGTMLHELMETVLLGGAIKRPTNHGSYGHLAHERVLAYKVAEVPEKLVQALRQRGLVAIAAEYQVWCDTAAGTADLIAWDEKLGGLRVLDWKFNGPRPFDEEGPWTKQLGKPFPAVKATKVAEFSVQLECYAAMLRSVVDVPVLPGLIFHARLLDVAADPGDVRVHETHDFGAVCKKWLQIA